MPELGLFKLNYRRDMLGVCSYYEMNVAKTVDENVSVKTPASGAR